NYLGEFIAAQGRVWDTELVDRAGTQETEPPIPGCEYFGGIDFGGQGGDRTAVVIAKRGLNGECIVVFTDSIAKLDFASQCVRLTNHLRAYNDARAYCDGTSGGAILIDRMRNMGASVVSVVFTQETKLRMVKHMTLLLETGRIKLPKPSASN